VNFLNIGASELILIILIAILAIGPRRMVQLMRTLGRTAGKLRRMSSEFMSMVNSELRETGLDPETVKGALDGEANVIEGQMKSADDETKETVRRLRQEIGSLQAELQAAASEARAFVRKEAQAEEDEAGPTKPVEPGPEAPKIEEKTTAQATAVPAEPAPVPRVLGALGGLDIEGERPIPVQATQAPISVEENAGNGEGTSAGERAAARESKEEAAQPG
jgi:sec-independent protein translocase protein TatB